MPCNQARSADWELNNQRNRIFFVESLSWFHCLTVWSEFQQCNPLHCETRRFKQSRAAKDTGAPSFPVRRNIGGVSRLAFALASDFEFVQTGIHIFANSDTETRKQISKSNLCSAMQYYQLDNQLTEETGNWLFGCSTTKISTAELLSLKTKTWVILTIWRWFVRLLSVAILQNKSPAMLKISLHSCPTQGDMG